WARLFYTFLLDAISMNTPPRFIAKQQFEVQVLSPVHVGTGREFAKGLDFVTERDVTHFLDADKIAARFVNDPQFIDALVQKQADNYLHQHQVNYKEYILHSIPGEAKSPTVREQMSDVFGKPYLPGSSIKGALRTALFQHLFEKNRVVSVPKLRDHKQAKFLEGDLLAPKASSTGKKPN